MTADNQSNERNIDIKGNADQSTLVTGDRNNIYNGPVEQTINIIGGLEATQATAGLIPPLSTPFFFPDTFLGEVFVGRENELKELHNLLQQANRVAIAAVGMGGIGKTTLARWYVRQHQKDYPGGIWWLPVGLCRG